MSAETCRGFGRVRMADLERAIVGDLLAFLEGSDVARGYAERIEGELAVHEAERVAELARLRARYAVVDNGLRSLGNPSARSDLGRYPAAVRAGASADAFAELKDLDMRIKAVELAERTPDDMTPRTLEAGLRFVMTSAPFRETDKFSDKFRHAFNRLVTHVELRPGASDGEVVARVRLDLGPMVGSEGDDDRDGERIVHREVVLDVFDEAAHRRGRRLDPFAAYGAVGGDMGEDAWSFAEPRVAHVVPTLARLGWQARPLLDVVRLCTLSGMGEAQREWIGTKGPLEFFEDAGRALVRSGALAAVVHAWDGSGYDLLNHEYFLSHVARPTPAEVATRVALSRAAPDHASDLRAAVVTALDGMPPPAVGKMHGLPADAVRELVMRHRRGDLDGFDFFEVGRDRDEGRARLLEAADACLDPALAARLRIGAMASGGVGPAAIADRVNCSEQTVRSRIADYGRSGPSAFWSRTWSLRPHAIAVPPSSKRHARALSERARDVPPDRRRVVEGLAAWCSGAAGATVLQVFGGDQVDFDRHLGVLRASGVPGLLASLRRPKGTPTPEGDRLRDLAATFRDGELERRMRLLAEFEDGVDAGELARRSGLSVLVLTKLVEMWRDTASICTSVNARTIKISRAQLDALADHARTSGLAQDPGPINDWATLLEFAKTTFGISLDPETFRRICWDHGIRVAWRRAERDGGQAA